MKDFMVSDSLKGAVFYDSESPQLPTVSFGDITGHLRSIKREDNTFRFEFFTENTERAIDFLSDSLLPSVIIKFGLKEKTFSLTNQVVFSYELRNVQELGVTIILEGIYEQEETTI